MLNTFLLIALAFVVYCVLRVRRFINNVRQDIEENMQNQNTKKSKKTGDLEKDPKTGVYKPKQKK